MMLQEMVDRPHKGRDMLVAEHGRCEVGEFDPSPHPLSEVGVVDHPAGKIHELTLGFRDQLVEAQRP